MHVCYSRVCLLPCDSNAQAYMTTTSHFACCLGDTLASELGILSRSPPRLITTFKPVPPGTNGALSTVGTIASVGGGTIMGAVMAVCLLWENATCRADWVRLVGECLGWGAVGGGFGSLVSQNSLSNPGWLIACTPG
jgi:uncharacterized membrane protein